MRQIRECQESQFSSFDQHGIFYRHWPAAGEGGARRAVVLLHRGHEHSGRVQHIVDELGLDDAAFFAWDARGHGRNEGQRGYSPSLASTVRDLDCFIKHISNTHGYAINDMIVIAQSVGAVLASTWVHDYAPNIRALVLAAPAFKVKLYVPAARTGIALMQKLRGQFFVNSYVKAKFLSHDPERIASYDNDPLITRPIASHILLSLYETAERIIDDAGAITVPTQVLISGADFVVHHAPQHAFYDRLGSSVKEKHVLDGFYHDTLGELEREKAFALIRSFIAKVDAGVLPVDLISADQQGYTYNEYRALQQPLSLLSPKRWEFGITRRTLGSIGKLSGGIQLGWQTGFDSGSTLDYVYRNQAQGITPLGKLGDRAYLDSVGWRGIRQRKIHLQELIGDAVRSLYLADKPVRIVDIAAGHGRYILDALEGLPFDSVLLRDYSDINVKAGQAMITQRGLSDKARFAQGNAFDRDSLANLDPKPTLAVVSGLYELFPENQGIRDSLAGLAAALPEGGYLVYTNQPWHPQLEMIARTLTSHKDGKAWVMRRRTQAEMDQLVAQAGFEKIEQRIDEWGIFTVSIAQRKIAATVASSSTRDALGEVTP
ncbi:class I SAM-dependent methyltransferase family protein [Chitinibacter fontanus]|uniref:Class I SAM-dependent methyltransferase family protein n=1 Tax=Chitinibacter fontanus TaxID=1737446 RepID=A0A7D5ZI83_9NEIS|nr:bifunctional alpha/beta hydrolase/class I SAM-dependent methyltransferase [Chitinibacter fontanus]QLI80970.1 class I SAM-dependent methyltransferase family protein [Chitinibacter fontanus]